LSPTGQVNCHLTRWYIAKTKTPKKKTSRFRTAYQKGKLTMSTDDIMALTRGE